MTFKTTALIAAFLFTSSIITSCKKETVDIETISTSVPADYNVVIKLFDHPFESKLVIQHDFDGNGQFETQVMEEFGNLTYALKITIADGQQYFKILPTISHNGQEIIDEIPTVTGIRAQSILVNGLEVTDNFIVDGANFDYTTVFSLDVSGAAINQGEGQVVPIPNAPAESSFGERYVRWTNPASIPESGFTEAIIWFDMLSERDNSNSSQVEVDYVRLYSVFNNQETLIAADEYENNEYAGTFPIRYPFFANDVFLLDTPPIEATVSNGNLVLAISTKPDNIWHLWNTQRGTVPTDCDYLIARARVKISGQPT